MDWRCGPGAPRLPVTATAASACDAPRRRVLVVHPAMAPYRADLFNLLARRFHFRVLFLNALPPYDANLGRQELAAEFDCDWDVVADTGGSPARSLPGRLAQEARTFRPDVVVTHEFGWASALSILTPLAGRDAARILWTTRSTDQFATLSAARRVAVRTLAPRADALLAYSSAARSRLAAVAGVPESRIFVCANHQDVVRLHRLADATRDAVLEECRRFGVADKPLVLTIGRLVDVKDVATTIRGFAEIRAALGDAVLVVVGEGPLRGPLQRLATDLGIVDRVLFVGHVPVSKVQGWLALASFTVLASLAEPFGAVVAEGLAHGAPCVCSTAAGAAVLVDGPARGVTVPPGDVAAMATALRSRLSDLRPACDLAVTRRGDLRPLTVHDDAIGFAAAVECAVAVKRGTWIQGAA